MNKIIGISILLLVFTGILCGTVAAVEEPFGPAPNSGDGIPDGSGFGLDDWQNDERPGIGPAPNSGDCDPDGSGF